jgi:gliding motility-associated-like protein
MKKLNLYKSFGLLVLFNLNCNSQTKTHNEGLFSSIGISGSISEIDNHSTGTITNDGELNVYNHYNNDGTVTYSNGSTTGMTKINGLFGFQKISGTIPMKWYNCKFDNSLIQPAFHLSNEIRINGTADFFTGIVDDDNYLGLVVFENSSNHINVKDQSHVDGFVRKNGNEAFKYPIGDFQQYRYASISDPSNTTDAFSGKYFLSNSNPLYPHANKPNNITIIDNAEYWEINKTSSTSNIFLTLSWDTDTTPSNIYNTPVDAIHIVRWDLITNSWIDEGGVVDAALKEITTVINPLTSYGIFTLARIKKIPCSENGLIIHNYLSIGNDALNDIFSVEGIENCSNNTVSIYNRWGVKVYETDSYNTIGNVFSGYSSGRLTLNNNQKLPLGTYFYMIEFKDESNGTDSKLSGYIYLE